MFKKNADGGSSVGKTKLLLILGGAILGVLLLIVGNTDLSVRKNESDDGEISLSEQEELDAYREALEKRIKSLCESVSGVERVTVAVSLGSYEDVYAIEESEKGDRYVIVGSGSNASALHVSRLAPEISGIGIVCRGGGNSDLHRELTELVSAAFHVPSNRIYVAEAKS